MRIYLTDQSEILGRHLEFLKALPLTRYDTTGLTEKTTTIAIDTPLLLTQINTDFLFAYNIFPTNAMTHLTEWAHERRTMRVGDTIVQQVYLPPVQSASLKIVVGVRVQEILNETKQRGFSYDTIEGHIEKGRATFILEQSNDNRIYFKVHTFSKPANVLARLVEPVFSVPYQTFLTRLALNNVKRQLESQNATLKTTAK